MEGGGGPEFQKVPDENKIITRSPHCRTYQSLEFANVVYESLRDGLSYLTTCECLVPGKCLDNTGLENFHCASHLPSSNTHALQPPAKKCSLHGPLGQALAQEGNGKPPGPYSRPFFLIPGPLPPLETAPSFFSWATGFLQSADASSFLAPTFL